MELQPVYSTEEWEQRVGAAIKTLRQRADLTQNELAARANVSLSAVKYIEQGRGSSLSTFVRVVRALGRTGWLDDLTPPPPTVSPLAMLAERRLDAAPTRVRHQRPPS